MVSFDVSGYGVAGGRGGGGARGRSRGGAGAGGGGGAQDGPRGGARVTLIDLDVDGVAREAGRLRGEGLDVRGASADVTDHAELDRVIDEAAEEYGRLDVVFANAGIDPGVGFLGAWAGDSRPRVE